VKPAKRLSAARLAAYRRKPQEFVAELFGHIDSLDAENARLREALESTLQELQRCATDGGGYSCAVVDEARDALEGKEGR
jgi:hypothetical protein